MGVIRMPKSEFIPHPEGRHEGKIVDFEDLGEKETGFGLKHKVSIKIESSTAFMNDGTPFAVWPRYTLSAHPKSELRKLRELLRGRKLTDEEAYEGFDPDKELVGKRVGFVVVHNKGREGDTFANVSTIWPLDQPASTGAPSGPASPPMPAGPAGPPEQADAFQVEYAVKLIAVCQANGMYSEEDAHKTTDWAESGVLRADMEKFIGQCEAALRARGVALPEAPGPKAPALPAAPGVPGCGGKDGLPF